MSLNNILLFGFFMISSMAFSQKSIFDLARSGSVDEIKELMLINSDTINNINEHGFTPLTLAAYNGNVEVAVFLVDKVKDINGNSKYGTPLAAAVFRGELKIVEALLNANVNPNIPDANGTTPLHYAVMARNEAIVKLLIDVNAKSDSKDNRGNSAKDYAEMTKNQNIILLLNKN